MPRCVVQVMDHSKIMTGTITSEVITVWDPRRPLCEQEIDERGTE